MCRPDLLVGGDQAPRFDPTAGTRLSIWLAHITVISSDRAQPSRGECSRLHDGQPARRTAQCRRRWSKKRLECVVLRTPVLHGGLLRPLARLRAPPKAKGSTRCSHEARPQARRIEQLASSCRIEQPDSRAPRAASRSRCNQDHHKIHAYRGCTPARHNRRSPLTSCLAFACANICPCNTVSST